MLYYYFESKEGLFREILRRRLHERYERAAHPRRRRSRPARRSGRPRLVGDTEYTRLLMWEALETDPDHPLNAALRREFFAGWVEAVEEEQRTGGLPADLDPRSWC